MIWRVTWRPGEQDFLVEREDQPIVVVRPRLNDPDGRADAQEMAELVANLFNQLDRGESFVVVARARAQETA